MSDTLNNLVFTWLPTFVTTAKDLLDDEDIRLLELRISEDPEVGDRQAGTGGTRKVRIGIQGRGRSSGARVIYYYRSTKSRVYLITVFAKNVKVSLSKAERNEMRLVAAAIDREP